MLAASATRDAGFGSGGGTFSGAASAGRQRQGVATQPLAPPSLFRLYQKLHQQLGALRLQPTALEGVTDLVIRSQLALRV